MFPLDNKEPYIKANGSRSTLGEMFDDAGADVAAVRAALDDEIETRAKLGAHNLLLNTATSTTSNGVTFTVNANKTITVGTGSGSAIALCDIKVGSFTGLSNVILSGCPSDGSVTKYSLQLYDHTASAWGSSDTGSGVILTLDSTHTYEVHLIVRNGVAIPTDITFYPMIRLTTDTDPTYQPYAMTSVDLTDAVISMSTDLTVSSDITTDLNFVTDIVNQVKNLIEDGKSISGIVTWTGHDRYAYTVTRSSSTRLFFIAFNNSAIYFGKQDGGTTSGKYVTGTAIT